MDMRTPKEMNASISELNKWKGVLTREPNRAKIIIHNTMKVFSRGNRADPFAVRRATAHLMNGIYTPQDFGGSYA